MKYVLLKMADGVITIIDNHDSIGKGRVGKLCRDGAVFAGTIESDLPRGTLKDGLERYARQQYDEMRDRVSLARKVLDGEIKEAAP